MKTPNEKKLDLLLDALSCIDDDILEQGLALREGSKASTAQPVVPPSDKAESATILPYLYDLSAPLPKPKKRKAWRATAVVAAACLLFCVLPLSFWMAAKYGVNLLPDKSEVMESPNKAQNETCADTNMAEGSADGLLPDEENKAPVDGSPEAEAPGEKTEGLWDTAEMMPEEPIEDATEAETNPMAVIGGGLEGDMEWTVENNHRDDFAYVGSYGGSQIFINGTVNTDSSQILIQSLDDVALKLLGQWYLSVYTLNYDLHFPLFPDEVIADRILPSFEEAGKTYKEGIAKITHTAEETFFIQSMELSLSLIANERLEADELLSYQQQMETYYPDSMDCESITYVRKIRLAEGARIDLDGRFHTENAYTEFYFYEYNGRWYLDARDCLDDDLCIDLFEADPATGSYYKTRTVTDVLTDWDEEYLYLEGFAIMIRDVKLPAHLEVGQTVTVTYHGLGAEFLRIEFDQTATEPVIVCMGDSVTIADP